jgi:hypothetical protein
VHTDSYRGDLPSLPSNPRQGATREYHLYTGRLRDRKSEPRYVLAGRFQSRSEAAEAAKAYLLKSMWSTYKEYEFRGDQEYRKASDGKCVRYYTPMEESHEILFCAWTVRVEKGAEGMFPPDRR